MRGRARVGREGERRTSQQWCWVCVVWGRLGQFSRDGVGGHGSER
jgi:hypothetical protein